VRFLADMGVARSVVAWLRQNGHDATHLDEQGLGSLGDDEVFAKASAERRIVLTFDLDFGEIVAVSRGMPAGVVLFRLRDARTSRVIERLRQCLSDAGPTLEKGAIVVVDDSRIRIRRLPVGT
jgi:predicted nuclease of predicted toxin-antitoxin system